MRRILWILCKNANKWIIWRLERDSFLGSSSEWRSCGFSLFLKEKRWNMQLFVDLAIKSSEKFMKKFFPHFQISHTHRKIWFLSEKDVTISYLMDSQSDTCEKSYFLSSKVAKRLWLITKRWYKILSIENVYDFQSIVSIAWKTKNNWKFLKEMVI